MKKLYLIACMILVATLNLPSKDNLEKDLPKLLSMSNAGREFYFTFIPGWKQTTGDLKIYVSSPIETLVRVEVEGKGYFKEKKTKPNDIIEFTLHSNIGQAYNHYVIEQPKKDSLFKKAGVRVYSDAPIICYASTSYDYASDAFLCLPVNVLGKEYIVSSYQDGSDDTTQWKPGYTGITSVYDKTKVTFTMGGNDSSRTAGCLLPGQTSTWNMKRGDVVLISTLGKGSDLTGSKITASKPVSVVSGHFCAEVEAGPCDILQEMEFPINTWGVNYHVTPIINRTKNSILRIFAKEPKTKVFREGQQIGYIRNAGGLKDDGWLEMRADTGSPRPVVISGDKPIGVTQYNTGQEDDNVVSNPFQMVLLPIEQYSREIIFNTPEIPGGFFGYNYLNLCYQADDTDSIPDDLEFAQVINGEYEWVKLKELSKKPGEKFFDTPITKNYFCKTILLPGQGVYRLRANKPIGAYAYGFNLSSGYGYPASTSPIEITKVDTLPPEPEWEMGGDGTVNVQKTRYVTDKPDDEQNRSNMSTIYMHADKSYNYKLYHGDFMPCEVQSVPWRLEIIDNREDAYAVVTFADCAGNDTTLYILFSRPNLAYSKNKIMFENCEVDTLYQSKIYLKNLSISGTANISNIDFVYKSKEFSVLDTNFNQFVFPLEIAIGDSLPLIIQFTSSITGKFTDSLYAYSPCSYEFKIPVIAYTEGTGISDFQFSKNFVIRPNPVDDAFTLETDDKINQITIFDVLGGQRHCPVIIGNNTAIVNTKDLNDGIYFIQIDSGKRILMNKFYVRK